MIIKLIDPNNLSNNNNKCKINNNFPQTKMIILISHNRIKNLIKFHRKRIYLKIKFLIQKKL